MDDHINEQELLFFRGARVIQFLGEESTLPKLQKNIIRGFPRTLKRQHAIDPIQIQQMKLIAYRPSKKLGVKALAFNTDGRKKYDTQVLFTKVDYENESTAENVTFLASNNKEYHIIPVPISTVNVKLKCTCLDFYWRFSLWNQKDGSLVGRGPRPYKKKTNRPPVNPLKVPGLCKHLIKTIEAIGEAGLIRM